MTEDFYSEDTIIFPAIDPHITRISSLITIFKRFCSKKQEIDPTDRFNFVVFTREGPIYLEKFTHDHEFLIDSLKKILHEIKNIKANLAGGIFLAVTFIIDVFKRVAGKSFRLIIILDKKTPHFKNLEPVLALLDNVVDFPFFIDIVKLGKEDKKGTEEDVIFQRLADMSSGTMNYAKSEKDLLKICMELANKKRIKTDLYGNALIPSAQNIDPEKLPFFENLAQNLGYNLTKNKNERCSICSEPGILFKCPVCGIKSHKECLAKWAEVSNIGFPNIFRCHNCFNLLKLDHAFMKKFEAEKKKAQRSKELFGTEQMGSINSIRRNWLEQQESNLRDEEEKEEIKLLFASDFMFNEDEGGSNHHPSMDLNLDNPDVYLEDENEETIPHIVWCPKCGKMLTSEYKFCTNCGTKLK
ncbi:MAG: zinc-ribbon domain-containing protein [Promethearchaeota archaeon]